MFFRYAYIFLVTAVRISKLDEAIIRILEEHKIKFNIIRTKIDSVTFIQKNTFDSISLRLRISQML